MAYSYNEVTATGSAQLIAVPAYIDQTHIKVSINSVDTTSFTWTNANTVSVTAAAGAKVRVRRESSPAARVVDYMDGMSLTEVVLDNDSRQAFYLAQEQLDATADAVGAIGGLADALTQMSALAAQGATSRDQSVSASSTAVTKAGEATSAAATATTKAGEATTAASTATAAASTASTKAGEAASSATAAAGSATDAASSATSAATSASSALTSATNAAAAAASVVSQFPSEVCYFARSTPPSGFLKANGAAVSRTAYAALFAAIGTTFGAGDGTTTFNVPDLRGQFIRGWSDNGTIDSGRAFGSSQTDALQNITGTLSQIYTTSAGGAGTGAFSGSAQSGAPGAGAAASAGNYLQAVNFSAANSAGVRTSTETRPTNIAVLACIKY